MKIKSLFAILLALTLLVCTCALPTSAKEDKNVEIINTRKVKSTSPGEWHVAIDAKITSK